MRRYSNRHSWAEEACDVCGVRIVRIAVESRFKRIVIWRWPNGNVWRCNKDSATPGCGEPCPTPRATLEGIIADAQKPIVMKEKDKTAKYSEYDPRLIMQNLESARFREQQLKEYANSPQYSSPAAMMIDEGD